MQRAQDQLEFQIETPSDQELVRRFADRQKDLAGRIDELNAEFNSYKPSIGKNTRTKQHKPRNRKSKQQKKQERIALAKEGARKIKYTKRALAVDPSLEGELLVAEEDCDGFEISPGTGIMSGCGAKDGEGFGDCPSCGG